MLFLSCVLRCRRATAYFVYSMQASTRIHNLAFARVLRVPISWFDANPGECGPGHCVPLLTLLGR